MQKSATYKIQCKNSHIKRKFRKNHDEKAKYQRDFVRVGRERVGLFKHQPVKIRVDDEAHDAKCERDFDAQKCLQGRAKEPLKAAAKVQVARHHRSARDDEQHHAAGHYLSAAAAHRFERGLAKLPF